MFKHTFFFLILNLLILVSEGQNFVISGIIRDKNTGEDLSGATVLVENLHTYGAIANSYGFFSLTLPKGIYRLRVQYVGYEPEIINVIADRNFKLDVELEGTVYELGDIKVSGSEVNHAATMEGSTLMIPKDVKNLPVIFGEPDLLKAIQLTAGVKPAGEGSSGFHVRGGGADQNLILLDEAPLYNPSHLMGFFSVFNTDALKNARLFKGGIPAEYGGRASSVLDIQMKEGNLKRFGVTGNLGLLSSNATVEGPLIKGKSSFILSGRRTYADLFLNLSENPEIRNSHLYFYDLNMKTNITLNSKNRIYLSGYLGRDDFDYKNNFGLDWGSIAGTFRWNHIFSNKLFSNTTFIYTNFSSDISLVRDYDIQIRSVIENLNLKQDFSYYINSLNRAKFGFNIIDHNLLPGRINLSGAFGIVPPEKVTERKALEWAVYVSNLQHVSDKLQLYYGLRLSVFSNTGPGSFYEFSNSGELLNTVTIDRFKIFSTSMNLEPRIGFSYKLNQGSTLKASFNRMHQYLHLISNATTTGPTDIWIPSSNNVKPQISDQFALGLFKNFFNNKYETSLEAYYKDLKNQIEYKNAAKLVYNSTVEAELAFGKGQAWGAEFVLKRKAKGINGWISYTWSKTMRQFDEVNEGKPFPANYDRTHDFSAVMICELFKWMQFSAAWVYYTGNPVTFPRAKYQIEGKTISYYTERNGYRMPDYHRLDLSLVLTAKNRNGFESGWNLSVYNAYNRENAYIIKFRNKKDNPDEMEAVKVSLFKAIPSLTYRFSF